MKRVGKKSTAQTPAPKKEQIQGSKINPSGSAANKKSAEKIEFNDALTKTIQNKVSEHNKNYPTKKVSVASAKAVVRRGFGAYSSSHRPNIPRTAWGIARLNKFLEKKAGKKVKAAYVQDDDLL